MSEFVHGMNDVEVRVNGVKFNLMANVRGNTNTPREAISGIGRAEAVELAPTSIRYSFSLSGYVLKKEPGYEKGLIFPRNERDLNNPPFTVEVFEKITGALLEKYIGCQCESVNTSGSQHAFYMKDASIMAVTREGGFGA